MTEKLRIEMEWARAKMRAMPSGEYGKLIDWDTSIHEIDLQLYAKYGLTDEEIDFIETHVKEMK